MNKKGIKIIEEVVGMGPKIKKGDKLVIRYDLFLNKGEPVQQDQILKFMMGDRNIIAGLRYGIEEMRVGGKRKFKASPHLCYREKAMGNIPQNALLIFDIKSLEYENLHPESFID